MTYRTLIVSTSLADLAKVLEHLGDGPVGPDGDVLGRHESADGVLGVGQQVARDLKLLAAERVEDPLGELAGQLFEQLGPLVGGHVVEDRRHLLRRQRLQQRLLLLDLQVAEDVGRLPGRQQPEHHRQVLALQAHQQLDEVVDFHVANGRLERREVLLLDELMDFRL